MKKVQGAQIVICIIFIAACFMRIYNIYRYNLWHDELTSNIFSRAILNNAIYMSNYRQYDFSSFLNIAKHYPPSIFYYCIVYVYSLLFGSGQSLRVISVVFSLFSLVIFYFLSRLFLNRKDSIYAFLIMAINPFHLWYAQEARPYSMACFFTILTVYSYIRALRVNKFWCWVVFTFLSMLVLHTSYYSIFLLMVTGVILLFREYRRCVKAWSLSIITALLLFMPILLIIRGQLDIMINGFWLVPPTLETLFNTFAVFNFGYSAARWQYYAGSGVLLFLFAYCLYSYYRKDRKSAAIIFMFLTLPIAITYLFSIFVFPIYFSRYLLIFSPFYYIVIAGGIGAIRRKIIRRIVMVTVAVLILISAVNYHHGFMLSNPYGEDFYFGVHYKKDYKGLIESIDHNLRDSDTVIAADVQSLHIILSYFNYTLPVKVGYFFYPLSLNRYERSQMQRFEKGESIRQEAGLCVLQYKDNKVSLQKVQPEDYQAKRIWLVSSTWERKAPLPDNYFRVRKYLYNNYEQESLMENDGVYVELYVLKKL